MEPVWLKSYPSDIPATYAYPEIPLYGLLANAARDFPGNVALHFLGKRTTYAQLSDQVDRFAGALHALGLGKGDRLGIVLPNCPQFVVAYYAAQRLGAVAVANNPLYTERELEHQLRDAGCGIVVTLDTFVPKVQAVRAAGVEVKHIIVTTIADALPFPKNVIFARRERKAGRSIALPADALTYMSVLRGASAPPDMPAIDLQNDLAGLVYTGGTTGVSKGVMLTHRNLVANAHQVMLWDPQATRGKEKTIAALPFFHSYGQTVCLNLSILMAGTIVLMPRFDLKLVLDAIVKQRPTLFPGVPTMYVAIINSPGVDKLDLTSIRSCISGAAPLPVEVGQQFEALTGAKLVEGYGLTETSPSTHANLIYGTRKAGSIGLPMTDVRCKLVHLDTLEELPPGEAGELCLAGPQIMKGYWNQPEETANVLRDGWLHTGDVASVDDDGFFFVVDRKKEMIITGGFNVYPREVEEVLYAHPKVKEAAIIGVPDQYRGEAVKAFVVPKDGVTVTAEEIVEYCKEKLGGYKVPRDVELRDELPKSMVGKVLRRVLSEQEKAKANT